tara:strand:- start:3019 stop:4050 length:1032 start_codon:yes stop_codon:yes gene_type:complete
MSLQFSLSKYVRIATTIAAITTGGALSATAQEMVTLKFGSFVGPTSFLNTDIFEPWFKKMEDESNGRLKIEFITGGASAKPQEVFDAVRAGIIDIGWGITAYNPGRFDAAGVVELPMLAHGAGEASVAMAGLYDQGLIDGMDTVKVLGIAGADIMRLHHSSDVAGLSDFSGAKIRAAGGVLSAMIEKIGGVPVGMPAPSISESLAKNVVDASANDWFALDGFSLIDVTKTHVDISLGTAGVYLVMNKASFDKLPDAAKAAIENNPSMAFAQHWGTTLEEESLRVRGVVAELDDHKIITPTEAELAAWQVAADEVIAEWVEKTEGGAEILQAYTDNLGAYRAGN